MDKDERKQTPAWCKNRGDKGSDAGERAEEGEWGQDNSSKYLRYSRQGEWGKHSTFFSSFSFFFCSGLKRGL